jgi:Ser/Thr protein kinase RdoA (MazF antagonist)
MPTDLQQALQVLSAWRVEAARVQHITAGHINTTFLVAAPDRTLVLQRLSPIFSAEVNQDILAITDQLARSGMSTPRLLPAADGHLSVLDDRGGIWRILTYLPGHTIERVDAPARGHQAGRLLGKFHRALWDCSYQFCHCRLGVHDTERHLAKLQQVLTTQQSHRFFGQIEPLARAILQAGQSLSLPMGLPLRVVHGDPKISNIIFDDNDRAVALIDLDTVSRMPLPVELGDALRSWCCPLGEEAEGILDLEIFSQTMSGYIEALGDGPSAAEWAAIPGAVETIAIELAARFCVDALEESYFGWDHHRFNSAAEHNLVRARAQLALGRSVRENLTRMMDRLQTLLPDVRLPTAPCP